MEKYKKWGAGILVVIFAIMGGFAAGFLAPDKVELPDDFNLADYVDLDEFKGDKGDRGYVGKAGINGLAVAGVAGKDGQDGKDAVVDMDKLADDVADLLEDRDEVALVNFGGNGGDYKLEFVIEDDGDYVFLLTHYGSGDFDVSLEDEDGYLSSLVDSEGHVNVSVEKALVEGTYKLRVSADGEWLSEVNED